MNVQIVQYAGFWRRIGAVLIDYAALLLGPVIVILFGAVFCDLHLSSVAHFIHQFGCFAALTLTWLYFSIMESSKTQGTLGKMLFRIQVRTLEGNRLSFLKSTARYWGKALFQLVCGLVSLVIALLICFIWIPRFGLYLSDFPLIRVLQANDWGPFSLIYIMPLLLFVVIHILMQPVYIAFCMAISPRKQLLHDLLTGTVVVKKPNGLKQASN